MVTDSASQYRNLLENDLPDFTDRVDDPWRDVPDCTAHNDKAYRRIVRTLNSLHRAREKGTPSSRGVLICGEAGTGKTHLLMRVARQLYKNNHICFVRRPNNEEAVAQHIWAHMLGSLEQRLHDTRTSRSQLDELLAHVFRRVIVSEFSKDVADGKNAAIRKRCIAMLDEDPYSLIEFLGEGKKRLDNLKTIRNRTLKYLQIEHPSADRQITSALLTYCCTSDAQERRLILAWLSGDDLDSKEAKSVGLPASWVTIDDASTDRSVQQQREEHALKAIQTLGHLSTYHQPLILAFDQLEGLRGQELLTQRWGDVTREIFTMAPNLLVVTCVFPSLWKEWFTPQLDESATQRISQVAVDLDAFDAKYAKQILSKQLAPAVEKHSLPSATYPFSELDISQLSLECSTPRQFLQKARAFFDDWLDGDDEFEDSGQERKSIFTTKSARIGKAFDKSVQEYKGGQGVEIQTEEDFYGRLRHIFRTLLRGSSVEFSKADWRHYVMPKNFIVTSRPYGDSLCIAVLNAKAQSFTSRIKNLLASKNDGEQFENVILLRSGSLSPLTKHCQTYLDKYIDAQGDYIVINDEEHALLNALYDTIVAIEEGNLSSDENPIICKDFVRFVAGSDSVNQSKLLNRAVTHANALSRVIETSTTDVCPDNLDKSEGQILDEIAEIHQDFLELPNSEVAATVDAKPSRDGGKSLTFSSNQDLSESPQFDPVSSSSIAPLPDNSPESTCVAVCDRPAIAKDVKRASTKKATQKRDSAKAEKCLIELGKSLDGNKIVNWELSIKTNPHLMLVGLPGMGKTTTLLGICKQLIQQDIVPIVFSYHQDIDEKMFENFASTNLFKPTELGFNPMQIDSDSPIEYMDNAGQIRDIFSAMYPDMGDVQCEMIRKAIKESYAAKGWGQVNGEASLQAPAFREFYSLLSQEEKPDKGLMARLEELDDYGVFSAKGKVKSLLDVDKPTVLQIHATQNENIQRAFAMFSFYSVYKEMFKRGPQNRITHVIIFDEAHRASNLNILPTMAKECRKYGISLLVSSQEAKDFDRSLFSAIANFALLRMTETDAKRLAKEIATSSKSKSVADLLKSLPKYEALFHSVERTNTSHVKLNPFD